MKVFKDCGKRRSFGRTNIDFIKQTLKSENLGLQKIMKIDWQNIYLHYM